MLRATAEGKIVISAVKQYLFWRFRMKILLMMDLNSCAISTVSSVGVTRYMCQTSAKMRMGHIFCRDTEINAGNRIMLEPFG